ncbi:hypothetical protein C8F04DRAFT_1263245 [Mycena alexandri]|uniref:Uncharacterized protein n=1 Tax=Mycena alexandri TaxID=1745969 RepID=A0AAD6WZG6_9AGAR|nr:hypothetical protein C8F04DRAFT_1263245 [Mycena alexandri]
MAQQNTSSLVAPGVIAPAVTEISTQIHNAQQLFIDTKTQFNLVNGSASATSNLDQALQGFTQFFLDTQTNASTAAANIQSFHSQAVKVIADPASTSALSGITFSEGFLAGKTPSPPNFKPIVQSLSASRQAVNTLAASIDAARHAALDAAIKKVEDLQTQETALKAQFAAALPDALNKLGMNSDSSSLELYLTIAPASLLDSLINMFKSKGGDLATKENREDLAAAQLALARLKEDQAVGDSSLTMLSAHVAHHAAADDQPGRLQKALISISQIQGAIAALSPQLQVLATLNTAMVQELNVAIALIKDAKYDQAKLGLENADAVFTQLESALKSFSTEA